MEKPKGFDYYQYLDSEEWRKIRDLVLDRDHHQCQKCGSKENLQVHHTTYEHQYDERNHLDDLITLCESCHHGFHAIEKEEREEQRRQWAEEKARSKQEKAELIDGFIEAYKHLDLAFGGRENLCKYEIIEKYWHQLYGNTFDNVSHKETLQGVFRDFKIDAILRMKAEGKTKWQVIQSGIPYKWVNKYWNGRKEGSG